MKKFFFIFLCAVCAQAAQSYRELGSGIVGIVTEANLSFSDVSTANTSTAKHGLAPKTTGNTNDLWHGDGSWSRAVVFTNLVRGMVAPGRFIVSTPAAYPSAEFELFPLAAQYEVLQGGAFGLPAWGPITENSLSFSDVTTGNASTTAHGLLGKLSGNTTDMLLGDGSFADIQTVVESIVGDTEFSDISAVNIYASADLNVDGNTYLRGQTQFGPGGAGGVFDPTTATLSVQGLEVGPIGSSPRIDAIHTGNVTADLVAFNVTNPQYLDISVTPAESGDSVILGLPHNVMGAAGAGGLSVEGWVAFSGVVRLKFFMPSGGDLSFNPANAIYNVTVFHY